jgi:electron transfer flavoprotein beta subunit
MKAVVGVRSSPHRVDATADGIDPYRWQLQLPDKVAVEAALQQFETVIAVGIGDERAHKAVRAALRMGADEGVRVAFDPVEEPLGEKYAKVLARVAGREGGDALLVGSDAPTMGPEVAGFAGETLGWPVLSGVTAIGAEAVEADVDTEKTVFRRKRRTGQQEVVAAEFPAVVGVDSGFDNPRRGSLDTVVSGQRTEVRELDLETVAPSESRFSMSVGRVTLESVTANERWGRGRPARTGGVESRIREMLGRTAGGDEGGGEQIDAPPEEAAERVVEYLDANDLL